MTSQRDLSMREQDYLNSRLNFSNDYPQRSLGRGSYISSNLNGVSTISASSMMLTENLKERLTTSPYKSGSKYGQD